ncbi:hypothetical protein PRIPAC_82864 [Pristionchus pacificus]|nr:hypothetical protein PRIPAC_82864 [Pristionchus pacificus]
MGLIFLLLLTVLLSEAASELNLRKGKAQTATEVPLLDLVVLSTTFYKHFGMRTEWMRCDELYPLLAVGDLIELVGANPVLKEFKFQHWAIYSGQINGTHFIVNYHLDPVHLDLGTVIDEPLNGEFDNRLCRINNREDWMYVDRIGTILHDRSHIGKFPGRYNLHDNNCEHLVRWSRNGIRKSLQVQLFTRPKATISIVDRQAWTGTEDQGQQRTACEALHSSRSYRQSGNGLSSFRQCPGQ